MLKSDNGRLVGYIYVDVADRDLGSVVQTCKPRCRPR